MESMFERLLKERLELMIDMKIEAMTQTGLATYDEYKHSLGYIEALRQTLQAMDEVQSNMRQE
jgi:hypothetical protein